MANEQCKYIRESGEQCQAFAVNGSDFCFSHDPAHRQAKHEATVKGGSRTKRCLQPIKVTHPAEIPSIIVDTINEVRTGQLTAKEGNTIAKLLTTLTQACGLK